MTYLSQNTQKPRRSDVLVVIVALLGLAGVALAFFTSDAPLGGNGASVTPEPVIHGEDWHGNVRRSAR